MLYSQKSIKSEDDSNFSEMLAQIGISIEKKHLNSHEKNGKPYCYRTMDGESDLILLSLINPYHLKHLVFSVPRFNVQRDVTTGGFAYNFNLNFSTTQDKLIEEGNELLDSPYLGTSKGREVFLNYLLSEKGLWILPAKNVSGGTSYPLSLIDPESPTPTSVLLNVNLAKKLNSLQIGKFTLYDFVQGDSKILDNLPEWPSSEESQEEKFNFPLFMNLVQKLMGTS